ncbi:class 1 fructose-bisphosphatase [Smaragdicoccus niigatensis]|uniref:class 1 fructose-bisphosphatase n=2 Tax=Smaragdicoccus niigatensis TaxID=359359 RepID=UPI000366816D|nr:class 1 fructose-bisphosphatase [Smaragdicoccus niigatensis]
MPNRHKTLTRYTIEEQHRYPRASGEFSALLNVIATAAKIMTNHVTRGPIMGSTGQSVYRQLDALCHDILVNETQWAGQLSGILSEGSREVINIPSGYRRGKYLLVLDPLDGSSNIDVNMPVGSIFSVLRAPVGVEDPRDVDFLQPGTEQVAAGFTLFGPATMLVLTTGNGVDGFTLDREIGAFVLTHPKMHIPGDCTGFSINAAKGRFWEPPVRRYVDECLQGSAGPRGRDFNMRWAASLVADTFQILTRGGIYLFPADTRDTEPGRVALLYGGNPIAFLIEQAGGRASTGHERVLELQPTRLHQRIPLIFGSRNEVERIETYHLAPEVHSAGFDTSLFATRSLFKY